MQTPDFRRARYAPRDVIVDGATVNHRTSSCERLLQYTLYSVRVTKSLIAWRTDHAGAASTAQKPRLLRRNGRVQCAQLDACLRRAQFQHIGAKIEFESAALVPDQVDFEIERRGISCLARLVWRDRDAAGLVFANVRETARRHSAGLGAQAARDRTGQPETPVAPRSASVRALDRMSTVEGEDAAILAAAPPPKVRRRRLRAILLAVFTAQYTIVAILVEPVGRGHAPLSGDAADRRKVRGDRSSAQALAGSIAQPVSAHTSIDLTEAAASRRRGRKRSTISADDTRSTCAPMLMAATIAPS